MKRLVVIVSGSGQSHDLEIQPGTTASDILRQIGLRDHNLQKSGEQPFGQSENVYTRVADGEKVYASSIADVGKTSC